jgi:hypothetical protein
MWQYWQKGTSQFIRVMFTIQLVCGVAHSVSCHSLYPHVEHSVCGLALGVSGPSICPALGRLSNDAGSIGIRTELGDTMKTALNSGTRWRLHWTRRNDEDCTGLGDTVKTAPDSRTRWRLHRTRGPVCSHMLLSEISGIEYFIDNNVVGYIKGWNWAPSLLLSVNISLPTLYVKTLLSERGQNSFCPLIFKYFYFNWEWYGKLYSDTHFFFMCM